MGRTKMGVLKKKSWSLVFVSIALSATALVSSAAATWNDTALGDSLAFGALALPLQGYSFLYRSDVAAASGNTVLLWNLGVPGWKSSDLLHALRTSFVFRSAVRNSRVVTWDIGGNDLDDARDNYKAGTCGGADNQNCVQNTVNQLKLNWDAIIAELHALRNFQQTIIRTMTIYNPYVTEDKNSDTWPNDAGTDFQVLKPYIDEVNAYITSASTAQGILVAPVYETFNAPNGEGDPKDLGWIAFDGFHPNTAGHAAIAALLNMLGYAPLVP